MERSLDTSRRLSERELEAWAGFLRVHGTISQLLDDELGAQHGISLSDYDVLIFLGNAPDQRLRMSELAESVLISQSGITRLVDRLVARGLVKRVRCSEDRRGAFAALTPAGLAKLREASTTHIAGVRAQFLSHLSEDEQTVLAGLWERILPDVRQTFSRLARRPG